MKDSNKARNPSYSQYGTGLALTSSDISNLPEVIKGKNFRITFQPRCETTSHFPGQREVVIEASTIIRAQSICDLIICSMSLWQATPLISVRDITVCPLDGDKEELPFKGNIGTFSSPDIPFACSIAAKASFRTSYVTSIHKYYLSCELHSNHWMELNPSTELNISLSPFPYDHLRYAYAIVIAFSIVEELKLAVNASQKNPSKIKGEWNPKVQEDLERRLREANINIQEPIVWERRGPKKSLETRRPPKAVNKTSWTYSIVRDCEVALVDAINDIGWLRSCIASHKVDKDIKVISVYDVSNAQHLARRLILESLGFWKIDQ